jgi:hypothetical protein
MPITAASVEANGWVLRLVVTASPGNFASYALAPDTLPRVVLSMAHPGFAKSAGTVTPAALARTLVATKPLRQPVNPLAPTNFVIDEVDLGGGAIQVRLALSEFVYATETGVSLGVLAGWRNGEAAASGIAVTNNSNVTAPLPIMRWVLPPYEVTGGSFRVSLLVVSHHPAGFEPVAGVKFTATDGTSVKTVWATELDTDNSFGDGLRCYTAIIEPASATALTAGLLRIDAEVYPWLGAMRTTDAAGTRAMTALATAGQSADAAAPWVIGYDPTGARYGQHWAFVDPINGTLVAGAAMITPTLALAKAIAPAARPASLNTAFQAMYLANRTLTAANGQAAQTRAADGLTVVLPAGVTLAGSTAVTSGLACHSIPATIIGDPADADPKTNCILRTGPNVTGRIVRFRFRNLKLEIGGTAIGGASFVHCDNIEATGKAGSETSAIAAFTGTPPTGAWSICSTQSRWWKTGYLPGNATTRSGLFRANQHSRGAGGLAYIKNSFISSAIDTTVTGSPAAMIGWSAPTLPGQAEDGIAAFNDMRSCRGSVWGYSVLPAAAAGTPNPSMRRYAFVNNLCERIGSDPGPFWSAGETGSFTMSYNIVEANSFVGERANAFYSDPVPVTVADTNTQLNQAFVNRVANNYFDWFPTKHDAFASPSSLSVRTAAGVPNPTGYRPQMIEAWSHTYGVCHEANVDGGRTGGGNFALEYYGARSSLYSNGAPGFVSDRSVLGSGAGGGDYRPAAASVLAGRVLRGNSDRDLAGAPRRGFATAGALQAVAVEVVPATAASANLAGPSLLGLALGLVPMAALHLAAATGTVVAAVVDLLPRGAAMAFSSLGAGLQTGTSALLAPAGATLTLGNAAVALLVPAGVVGGFQTLRIGADLRTVLVKSN